MLGKDPSLGGDVAGRVRSSSGQGSALGAGGVSVASLEFDKTSQCYRIRFRFAGRAFKRSLATSNRRLALATLARAEETLALIANDRLEVPEDVDPADFILSDGKRTQPISQRKIFTLGELCQMFQEQRVPGAKEASTIRTENLHIRTLQRVLKKTTFVQSIRNADLQDYVLARLNPKDGHRSVAADTIQKEIATLRVIWNWQFDANYLTDRHRWADWNIPSETNAIRFAPGMKSLASLGVVA